MSQRVIIESMSYWGEADVDRAPIFAQCDMPALAAYIARVLDSRFVCENPADGPNSSNAFLVKDRAVTGPGTQPRPSSRNRDGSCESTHGTPLAFGVGGVVAAISVRAWPSL